MSLLFEAQKLPKGVQENSHLTPLRYPKEEKTKFSFLGAFFSNLAQKSQSSFLFSIIFLLLLLSLLLWNFVQEKRLHLQNSLILSQKEVLKAQNFRINGLTMALENITKQQQKIYETFSQDLSNREFKLSNSQTLKIKKLSSKAPVSQKKKDLNFERMNSAPDKFKEILKGLRFHGHLFISGKPKSSFILVNDSTYQEGEILVKSLDATDATILLRKIMRDGVILEYKKKRYFLDKDTYFPSEVSK